MKSNSGPLKSPNPPDQSRKICFCYDVTEAQLRAGFAAGARTLAEIQSQTLADAGCMGCEFEVLEILKQLGKELEPSS